MSLLIKEGNTYNVPKRVYLCDTVAEFQNIPFDTPSYSEVVILTSPIARKMKKEDGTWVDVPISSDGGGGGSGGPIDFTEPITVLTPTSDHNPATKKYVDDAISNLTEIDYLIVENLPPTGTKGIIYLIRNTGTNDTYDEYLWIGQAFEKIGNTAIDLSNYIPRVTGVTGYVPKFDSDGALVSSGYTLGKTVPSDAVFTDTTYSNATQSQAGLMSGEDKIIIDNIENEYVKKTDSITSEKLLINIDGEEYVVRLKVINGKPFLEMEEE